MVTAQPGQPVDTSVKTFDLPLIEDLRAVAIENHRRQLPLIQARAIIRATAKSAASFAGTQALRHNSRGDTENIAAIGAVLAGLAFVALTERADLRTWATLPGLAHASLIDLPPGEWNVRVEYLGGGGGIVYATPWKRVVAREGGLITSVEEYWR